MTAEIPTRRLTGFLRADVRYLDPAYMAEVGKGLLAPTEQIRLLKLLLVLGIVARCVRFFLKFPLWEDECFLCVNFVTGSYSKVLEPLEFHQVAPPLFLWIEVTATRLFGFSEWSLRLFPFVCSIASVFLFRHLASRLLAGLPLLLAFGAFAVGYPGIRYAAEAKQYSSDLFASLVMVALVVEWWRAPNNKTWLWLLAGFVPLAVTLSYTAVFVAGAIGLFVLRLLFQKEYRGGRLAWMAYSALLVGGFAVLLFGTVRSQSDAELDWMANYWQDAFPPITEPARLPEWLLSVHTGDFLAYPIGDARGGSTLTFLCCLLGAAVLLRRDRRMVALLCLAPAGLQLAAAFMQRYPYGGHVKFSQHLAPMICLLSGLGGAALCAWLARRRMGRRVVHVWVGCLVVLAAGSMIRDVIHPYKTRSDERARAFARWFWFSTEFEGETVCLKTDLGRDLSPDAYRELTWSAMYLCNLHIYSPRHERGEPPQLDEVESGQPLRCVVYRAGGLEFDEAGLDEWLAAMRADFKLVGQDRFPFPRYDKREKTLLCVDYLDSYSFVPRQLDRPIRQADLMSPGGLQR